MDEPTVTYETCPAPGVSLGRLCDLADGALLALNLALGPQVLVMTALVMLTSLQVALHSCCFGETTKKGAAFTYSLFCGLGAFVSFWTLIEGWVLLDDIQEIAKDLGATTGDVDSAQDDVVAQMVEEILESPLIQFFIFTSFLTMALRIAGLVLKCKKHGPCC
jgi:hypothetical protein